MHVLPYLEQQALYEQFHLDEPWDSEHNRALIAKMPDVFREPANSLPQGKTPYLAVTGPGTAFDDPETGPALSTFTDGTAKTIVLVEANTDQGVEWTRPEDWQFDPNDPTRGLGGLRPTVFLAATADGRIHAIPNDTKPEKVGAMMTRAGREPVTVP